MAFGLEFINDAGSLCISESYKNPLLVATGTATTVAQTAPWLTTSKFTISYTRSSLDEAVIMAMRPSDMAMLIGTNDPTSLTWTWSFFSDQAVGTSVPYYIFSNKGVVPADTFGLEVYDGAGNRVFSSAGKPLRLRGFPGASVGILGATTDFIYETGRTWAVAMLEWSDRGRYIVMSDTTEMYGGGAMVTTSGIRLGGVNYVSVSGNGSGNPWSTVRAMAIDVTGY